MPARNKASYQHWPEDRPLGVSYGLERQHNDDDEDGRDGEAEQIPDERRQPVTSRVDAAHELRMLRFVWALVYHEHDERPDQERQTWQRPNVIRYSFLFARWQQ